jgi:acetyl esterase
MPLDPQAEAVIADMGWEPIDDLSQLSPEFMRESIHAMAGMGGRGPAVDRIEDLTIPGPEGELRARLYGPAAEQALPLLVFFHGGGFVVGDLETHDAVCRTLANEADCIVVSIAYRLAPEAPYPAAAEDCYAATLWVAEHAEDLGGDAARIAVGGDSAGGNLAAVVALMARDRGQPLLSHQLLIYPVIDHAFDTDSYRDNADGFLLTRSMMQWFWGHYLADAAQGAEPYASPIRAADLSGVAPATVITAEYDPLRDEGEAYARRLDDAGVPTTLYRFDGMIHGFFGMTDRLDRACEAVAFAADELREAWED